MYVLMMAASEFKDRIKALAVDFRSIYGHHQIPMLVDSGGDSAVYVEAGEWDRSARTRFIKWIAALRTSELEDLPVLIRSPSRVPVEIARYAEPSPANAFELAGSMNVHWTEAPGFAELNASTVKRLVQEYFDKSIGDGIEDLDVVDDLVSTNIAGRGDPLPSSVILLGCYFGQVLVRQLHGEWIIAGGTTSDVCVRVSTPTESIEANVFGKASKLLRNGIEDSMAGMAQSIANRLRK